MPPDLNIGTNAMIPKYKQVVNAITDLIRRGKLKKGDKVLSINELSEEYFISRVTVEKAYNILREKGIIVPIKGKGFYVNKVSIDAPFRVLLVFNKISNYKRQTYTSFIQTLGSNAMVDLVVHHFDHEILQKLIDEHRNNYDYFVIMPFFYENYDAAVNIIKTIPLNQLIIMDRRIPYFDNKCGIVYQNFEKNIIDALTEGLQLLKKYSKLYFVYPTMIPYPPEMRLGFKKFCMQNQFKNEVLSEITNETRVQKGEAYIVIEESDLAELIKTCIAKKLKVGRDVGIIAYNETPLKGVILDGITVVSTDHKKMGEMAANLILTNSTALIENPFQLIIRKSL
jgi:DNA-binding transcriptional regulator YhcF (GntR family)